MSNEIDWPEWNRRRDPELWDFYAANILEPGWPGQLTEAEYAYIKEKLSRSRRLRRRWGFVSESEPVCFETVQAVAMWGEPSDPSRNTALIQEAAKEAARQHRRASRNGVRVQARLP